MVAGIDLAHVARTRWTQPQGSSLPHPFRSPKGYPRYEDRNGRPGRGKNTNGRKR